MTLYTRAEYLTFLQVKLAQDFEAFQQELTHGGVQVHIAVLTNGVPIVTYHPINRDAVVARGAPIVLMRTADPAYLAEQAVKYLVKTHVFPDWAVLPSLPFVEMPAGQRRAAATTDGTDAVTERRNLCQMAASVMDELPELTEAERDALSGMVGVYDTIADHVLAWHDRCVASHGSTEAWFQWAAEQEGAGMVLYDESGRLAWDILEQIRPDLARIGGLTDAS